MTPACGDDDASAAPAAPPASRAQPASPGEGMAPDPDVEDEVLQPADDVAEPSERERLEVECFHGSTDACDRLGH